MRQAVLVAALALAGCGPTLKEAPPLEELARRPATGASAEEILRQSEAAWERRADPAQARAAEELALDAAAVDGSRTDALAAAIRAKSFRIERERDPVARRQMAASAVRVGDICRQRAPQDPACAYWLAVALGQQTRERPTTAQNALPRIIALLHEAAAGDERLDCAGPHRVLALLLVRAPAWPFGPGDPETALVEAQQAAKLCGDFAPNQLALAEAQAKTGDRAGALASYDRARQLAWAASRAGDPDAERWVQEASAGVDSVARAREGRPVP